MPWNPALLAAAAAGYAVRDIFGYLLRNMGSYKEFVRSRIFDLVNEVNALRDLSIEYWSRSVTSTNIDDGIVAQEAKMVAKNHAINVFLVHLSDNIRPKHYADLKQEIADLRIISTSAPFEEHNQDRIVDPQKIKEIHKKCFDITLKLNECAKSPRGIFKKIFS